MNKEMAGVYSYLPMGFRVLKKIEGIIRREMEDTLNAQEVLMPALHPLSNYKETGREDIDVLFHTELNSGGDLVLGQSHEEIVVPMLKHFLSSYRDLPLGVFQIQTKFRNEMRAKSGVLRGREFLMKDLYSFHENEECLARYYERAKEAYRNIFKELEINERTYFTFASGGSFSDYSHEFQTVAESGEDTIYLCENCGTAVNEEIIEETTHCPECNEEKSELLEKRAIEVGNIFPLHTRFSEPFNLTYKNKEGEEKLVLMGCYGIGVSRVMGAIVESLSDEKGIVWPNAAAPFSVHLISLNCKERAEELYKELLEEGVEVLYDDREEKSPGERFAESDLIGIPCRMIVSEKNLREGVVEIKKRNEEEPEFIKLENTVHYVRQNIE